MTDLHFLPAVELVGKLKAREISAVELLDHYLARVERHNPALNAIIWMDPDGARARAHDRLQQKLIARADSARFLMHQFFPIVEPTNHSKTNTGSERYPHEPITEISPQQGRHSDGDQDQGAPHGRGTHLTEVGGRTIGTNGFTDL